MSFRNWLWKNVPTGTRFTGVVTSTYTDNYFGSEVLKVRMREFKLVDVTTTFTVTAELKRLYGEFNRGDVIDFTFDGVEQFGKYKHYIFTKHKINVEYTISKDGTALGEDA